MWQWSRWCAGVYATRADLPIMTQSILATMAGEKEEAIAEARRSPGVPPGLLHARTG